MEDVAAECRKAYIEGSLSAAWSRGCRCRRANRKFILSLDRRRLDRVTQEITDNIYIYMCGEAGESQPPSLGSAAQTDL